MPDPDGRNPASSARWRPGDNTDCAVVIGGSRGVGAALTRLLAAEGTDVLVVCRRERPRLYQLVRHCVDLPGRVEVHLQDLTAPGAAQTVWDWVDLRQWRPRRLYLCASGGMELGTTPAQAMSLNAHAPVQIVSEAVDRGHRLTAWFLTSHQAHHVRTIEVEPAYRQVAETKKAGEEALLERARVWHPRGVRVGVASADVITDSVTTQLMERQNPGSLEDHLRRAGDKLPTTVEVAEWVLRLPTPGQRDSGAVLMSPYP